jgi:hypothetical protein
MLFSSPLLESPLPNIEITTDRNEAIEPVDGSARPGTAVDATRERGLESELVQRAPCFAGGFLHHEE